LMLVPPPKTLALELMTPSVEMNAWAAELGEMSANEMWKFCKSETFTLSKGTPPLSSNKTLKFRERVVANGQPAVPPPTIM
ncbi:hypothetical protein U1Q18_026891, partial [Sarracenia purpurea var. burkii]